MTPHRLGKKPVHPRLAIHILMVYSDPISFSAVCVAATQWMATWKALASLQITIQGFAQQCRGDNNSCSLENHGSLPAGFQFSSP